MAERLLKHELCVRFSTQKTIAPSLGFLALGQFSLEEAAKYLEQKVPMDAQTARQEATAFSTGPGQALTYQIGKLQITQLLAEARLQQGDKFNLRAFHDFVWKNGNVPIALQRWEYLGASDEVEPIPAK